MKQHILLLILSLTVSHFNAKSQEWQEIRNSNSGYLWGEGTGRSLQEADKNALDDLSGQISVQVKSSFEQIVVETESDINTYVKSVIETYSTVTLPDQTERMVQEGEGQFKVLRYILRADVSVIFKNRLEKALRFTESAVKAEKEYRIADALRYYYWALVMLRSHPDNNTLQHPVEGLDDGLLIHVLSDRIIHILSSVQVEIEAIDDNAADQHRAVTINITFKGQAVENFEYQYWIGNDWDRPVGLCNGKGVADFYGEGYNTLRELRLRIEYKFINRSRSFDMELYSIMDDARLLPSFAECEKRIPLIKTEAGATNRQPLTETQVKTLNEVGNYGKIMQNVSTVIQAIEQNNPPLARSCFTDEGYRIFMLLSGNGKVNVLARPDTLSMISLNNEIIVRSVPMSFSFRNNTRVFVENVVFAFNEEAKIVSLAFALSPRAVTDILNKGDRFGAIEERYHIIRFMEDYKTAYCLRRIDFIGSLFAENALIIVGRVLKDDEKRNIDGYYHRLDNDRVEYIKMEKREYMERLRLVFEGNEFVNVHFEENDVKRVNNNEKIYGIQISQQYFSSNYSDKGYLFLMIDLQDSLNPRIYVRSWQPEKNPDGSVTGLSDFYF